MSTPLFIGEDTFNTETSSSSSGSVVIPAAAQAGDVALLVITEAQSGNGGIPTISGATFATRLFRTGTDYTPQMLYWSRVLDGTDPGRTITATWGSNRNWSISVLVYRGVVTDASPIGGVSAVRRGTGTAVTHNGLTVGGAESLVIGHIAAVADLPSGFPTPSLFTERVDNGAVNRFRNHQVAERAYGSTGVKTPSGITLGRSTTWAAQALELLAAPEVDGFPKVWNGLAWVPAVPKVWDGSSWVPAVAKVWDGSGWVLA